jgi:phosphoribulokinase
MLKPVYDHSNGTLARSEDFAPAPFLLADSLFGLHSARMRACFDVKVYLDPPEELRRIWKGKRDTTKRRYSVGQVLEDLEARARFAAFHPPAAGARRHRGALLAARSAPAGRGRPARRDAGPAPEDPDPNLSELLKDTIAAAATRWR